MRKKIRTLAGPFGPPPVPPATPGVPDSLSDASGVLSAAISSLGVDAQPTALQLKTIADARARAAKVMARWRTAKAETIRLNARLKAAGLPELEVKGP